MNDTPILDAALAMLAAGYSVVPIRSDGSKAPAIDWKRLTQALPTEDVVRAFFAPDDPRQWDLGVVQGAVSGNAEMTEIEGRAAARLSELKALADDSGLGTLWSKITSGWVEASPSGGIHFHYRLDGIVPGNTKLARRPSTPDELADWKTQETAKAADITDLALQAARLQKIAHTTERDVLQVLAETRGEGGQVVVAPSRHHATGRPWMRLIGGPSTAVTLTLDERDAFHALLRTLDETPDLASTQTGPVVHTTGPRDPSEGVSPLDDYEARTDWADILTPHGWVFVTQRGGRRYWRRPGKTIGISATTGGAQDGRDRLYVFTSSTDFQTEIPYTKPGAYTVLEHAGDHAAAAKALYAAGYGQRAEERRTVDHATSDDLAALLAPTTATPTPQPGTRTTNTGTPTPTPVTAEPVTYSPTDDGNALRLVDTYGQTIRYVRQRGAWITWNGHRWVYDNGAVSELARDIARHLPTADPDGHRNDELARHRKSSLSRRGLEAMPAIARNDTRVAVDIDQLDAHPYELNTPAGVVNLRTGTLSHPNPAALHTRTTTVAPDFTTTPARWNSFLADTFAGDPTMATYIQRLIGISLVGQVLEQLMPFAHGSGANGKTTFAGVLQRLLGLGDDGYALSAPAEMLLDTTNHGHPTEIARLSGARLVISSELEDGQRFGEARVKQLTGSDPISGRFMRQDWFTFTPTHTLWLLANHLPTVKAGGPAFWRRIRMLPFEHVVPEEARIAGLEDQLVTAEGPAILAWAIRGAADYFTHGLAEPPAARAATIAYERDTDTVARFVDERCSVGSPNSQLHHVKSSALRSAYEAWCRTEGEEPVSPKALSQQLVARFSARLNRDTAARWIDGIRLLEPVTDEADASSAEPRDGYATGW